MVMSMTGFGRAELSVGSRDIIVEMKSVNHRYFEFSCRTSRGYSFIEDKLKKYAVACILIGVALSITFAVLNFIVRGGTNYADKPVNRGPLYAACAYFGSLAMLAGMASFGDFSNDFTKWMSTWA